MDKIELNDYDSEKFAKGNIMDGLRSKIYHRLNNETKESDNIIVVLKNDFEL